MATVLAALAAVASAAGPTKPHIVYYLVDDLGYSNVGFTALAHNDEPLTPHIDGLANSGVLLNRFYTYRFCSPTRSSFISGRLPIHVNQVNHPPEYPGGGVPLEMTTIADKLTGAGYLCHQLGKWHCGMSGSDRIPTSRGFNSSFGYLSGAEDHYLQTRDGYTDFWRSEQPAYGENGTSYATFLYTAEALKLLRAHDPATPFFLYLAYQNVHGPTQAPTNYTALYPKVEDSARRLCLAMISAVDESIGIVTSELKAQGMYDNTLLIFSSDNGGPSDHANNWPLRGSKATDWEGGTRVAAFISGGFVPAALRGQHRDQMMHVCDWYATFSTLAGYANGDPKAAAAHGIPAPDAIDMWPYLSGAVADSPRLEIALRGGPPAAGLAGSGYIARVDGADYKLIRGTQNSYFPGPHMPNSTANGQTTTSCGAGCLFNLSADPTEHVDLAVVPANAALLARLQARALALDSTYFQSKGSATQKDPAATRAAINKYHGFWGPWMPPGPIPSPPPGPPAPPARGGFRLQNGTGTGSACLSVDMTTYVATLAACDAGSQTLWNATYDGELYSTLPTCGTGDKFLRHHPPGGTCAAGTPMQLGMATKKVFSLYDAQSKRIFPSDCPGMSAGIGAGGEVVLVNGADSAAVEWTKVAA